MLGRFLLLILLAVGVMNTHAQELDLLPEEPLIAYFNDTLYLLEDTTLVSYDACTPDESLTPQFFMSPDGARFIMATIPRIINEAIDQVGSLGDLPFGLNLWICDTRDDSLERIVAVEGGDAEFTGDIPESPIVLSAPVWSPDGRRIAWTKLNVPDDMTSIVLFDTLNGTQLETVLDISSSFGFPIPPQPYWVQSGIFFVVPTLNDETFENEDYLYVYDVETDTVTNEILISAEDEFDDFEVDRFPVTIEGENYLAQRYFESGWVMTNLITGEQTPIDAQPRLTIPDADNSLSVSVDIDQNYNYNWRIVGEGKIFAGYPPPRITLSPNGDIVAFADGTLHFWQDNQIRDISNSDGFADDPAGLILWGAPHWEVVIEEEIVEEPLPQCEGALQSRLRIGDEGIVRSIANNLRDEPSVSGQRVGQLNSGQQFVVLDGPVCAGGYTWYEVELENLRGWTAEGTGVSYWLIPVEN